MKTYIKRLKNHPGVPVMAMMTFAFVFAGMANENFTVMAGAVFGFLCCLPFWAIVLWTARTQPLPMDED